MRSVWWIPVGCAIHIVLGIVVDLHSPFLRSQVLLPYYSDVISESSGSRLPFPNLN